LASTVFTLIRKQKLWRQNLNAEELPGKVSNKKVKAGYPAIGLQSQPHQIPAAEKPAGVNS